MKTFTPETAAAFLADLAAYKVARGAYTTAEDVFIAALTTLDAAQFAYDQEGDEPDPVPDGLYAAFYAALAPLEALQAAIPKNPDGGGLFNGGSWEPLARAVVQQYSSRPERLWVEAMDKAAAEVVA
jgi:hypothetical protein